MPDTRLEKQGSSVIRDKYGAIILEIAWRETTLLDVDGNASTISSSDNIQLVCGSIFNPAQSKGADPAMLLSVCERCRHAPKSLLRPEQPTHGLCSTRAGYACQRCGEFRCPRHAVRGRDGGHRCESCAWKYAAKRALRTMFFRREE